MVPALQQPVLSKESLASRDPTGFDCLGYHSSAKNIQQVCERHGLV